MTADRPLPYRAFLNKAYNDDGIEVSYVLPTDFILKLVAVFSEEMTSRSVKVTEKASAHFLHSPDSDLISAITKVETGWLRSHRGSQGGRAGNEETVTFIGDSDLYAVDFRYTFAPKAMPERENGLSRVSPSGEAKTGTYEDTEAGTVRLRMTILQLVGMPKLFINSTQLGGQGFVARA